MIMKRKAWLVAVFAALVAAPAAGQATGQAAGGHFYDVDKEVRFEGTVREIVLEPRYKGTAPFLVLRVEDSARAKIVTIEVSPSWFFGEDVHGGEKVKGIGSLSEAPDGALTIMARELQLRGETLTLRDKRGFPNWQGGARGRRGPKRHGSF
jgi:hypothetical protein